MRCAIVKPLDQFTKDRSQKDGLSRWCKQCKALSDKRYITGPRGGGRKDNADEIDAILFSNGKRTTKESRVQQVGNIHCFPAKPKLEYGTEEFKIHNRNLYYLRTYKISLADYEIMYDEQGGCCLICGEHYEVLCIDHCHESSIVRGLLCSQCNSALGLLKEKISNFENAIKYLQSPANFRLHRNPLQK